eukprot:CAMPEP_0113471646 /NCGR_PEP_ID=MMETSP0014_2-20120614/17089_1 /TAXON_ID=2857 /ORGANISM="Nitzschia sp." /LENGTH=263 /DNA_ID=CAMNT_0000364295 /DNA_START=10 /DNA_END=801 /DNA_ORIENTATION=+ /assembly_acc=CAM_ASM_000159
MAAATAVAHVKGNGDRGDDSSKDLDDADKDVRATNMTKKSEEEEEGQKSESELSKTLTLVVGLTLLGTTSAVYYADGHGLIDDDAKGSKLINAFYCAVMTLTTIGFGDICPGPNIDTVGTVFLTVLPFIGLGFVCGPMLQVTATWKEYVPGTVGGIVPLAIAALLIGVSTLVLLEDMTAFDALHLSVITATTIGFGNSTPRSDLGRLGLALYALLAINIIGCVLDVARKALESLCQVRPPSNTTQPSPPSASKTKDATDKKED